MLDIKTINHSLISDLELKNICNIKSAFGDYSEESQLTWIQNNLNQNDKHFLIYDNDKLIAYANLINEFITIDNQKIQILGLGNVCVDEKGKEKGVLLMNSINDYLYSEKITGLLFCKKNLIPFYNKANWNIILPHYSSEISWMIFNHKIERNQEISFTGKLF